MALLKRLLLLVIVLLLCVQPGSAVDLVYGLIPTYSGWFSTPASPSYITDNNLTSYDGGGSVGGTGTGIVLVDTGVNRTITELYVKYGSTKELGSYYDVRVEYSINNINWSIIRTDTYMYGGGLDQSISVNNIIFRYLRLVYYNPAVGGMYGYTYDIKVISMIPNITYPVSININKSYPPLTENINFTWFKENNVSSNIIIAKDQNFNLIAVDTITSNNYSVQSLEAGNYWWKVRYYNATSGTYYPYSNVSNFTLTNLPSATGTGIQGTIYEFIDGVTTPVSGATVYLYNNTLSETQVTGSNGYFLFQNLANATTYNIYASKAEYDTTPSLPLTTGYGNISTKDILIKKTETPFFEADRQYVKFRVRWLYCYTGCNIDGVTLTVYKSGEVLPYATGVTDSQGVISLLLYKTQLYRITATDTVNGISEEMNIYPKDTEYVFLISNSNPPFTTFAIEEKDGINIVITKDQINNVSANITVNYTDNLAATTAITIYLNRTNISNITVPIVVSTWIAGAGNQSHTFSLTNYSSDYLVHIVATHGVYGTIDRTYSVTFSRDLVSVDGVPSWLWLWFGVGFMFFTAGVFTKSTSESGFIIVCAEGWIFLAAGVFSYLDLMPNVGQLKFGIGLTIATVLAFLAYFKKSQQESGMP